MFIKLGNKQPVVIPTFTNTIQSKWYSKLVLFCLYAFTLLVVPYEPVSKIFYSLFVLLSFPILFTERKSLYKDPMMVLFGISLILQVLSWFNATIQYPEFANEIPKLDRLAKLFVFIFIAYWLKGNIKQVYLLLACFIAGIVLGFIINSNDFIGEVSNSFKGTRIDFATKNAQFTSMFSGIGLVVTSYLIYHLSKFSPPVRAKRLCSLILTIACLFFLFVTVVTQSRQIWLALTAVIVLLPIITIKTLSIGSKKNIFIYYAALLIISISLFNIEIIQSRINEESNTVNAVISGNFDHIPMTSIGIRINSWIEALSWIKQHPLLGAGPSAIAQVMIQAEKFKIPLSFPLPNHLHNYHMEILVSYGLLGLLVIYAVYGWLIMSFSKIKTLPPEQRAFAFLAASFCIYWFIANCFESFNARTYGVFTHNIMLGCCYTFYLTHSLQSKRKE